MNYNKESGRLTFEYFNNRKKKFSGEAKAHFLPEDFSTYKRSIEELKDAYINMGDINLDFAEFGFVNDVDSLNEYLSKLSSECE
ncbi:MAG: hypothetical protein N4A76_05185 [Firmicutes bacterium]|nr:hypothetical protein [Bacillota bacterium]